MSLKLDPRIKSITHIQSVTSGCDDWELYKKGYFAQRITDFEDLKNKCIYGKYVEHRFHDKCFHCEVAFPDGTNDREWYAYYIPEDVLKPVEKKYRPYTVMEFIKYYPIGSHLHFRPKDKTIEMHRLIDGYNDCLNGAGTVFMCGAMFSMSELYDNYEIFKDGKWQPFGVIDE